jgi:hypothetical protein
MAKPPTDAEIRAQIPAARAGARADREAGLRATSVRYDARNRRLVLELTNGYALAIPVSTLPDLVEATAAQLAGCELDGSGGVLSIPALDADYSVAGLVLALTAREVGRLGGAARSEAKTRAAKANGAKGGRPRKVRQVSEPRRH